LVISKCLKLKVQSSKFKGNPKSKYLKDTFGIWPFDIDLTFACLREAATAKAGVLTFGFSSLIVSAKIKD